MLATLVLVPAYWLMLVGLVDVAVDDRAEGLGNPAAGLAAGLAIIPFVFIILAFVSEHPRAPGAVVRAMLVSLAVGLVVSGLVGDAVSGLVAGVGAGGACALRPEPGHSWRGRAVAVLVATIYTAVLVRTIGAFVLVPAPVFPLTAVGLADHAVARRDLHAAATR